MQNDKSETINQAIQHYQYGIDHDIFSDDILPLAKVAVEALNEKQEHEQLKQELEEYKKTNLTPEEINNVTIIIKSLAKHKICTPEQLQCAFDSYTKATLSEAKEQYDGLTIKLPMKDKTKLYVLDYKYNKVCETEVQHQNTRFKNGIVSMAVLVPGHMGMVIYFTKDDIGKTIFLTKEQAEEALKGLK